MSKERDIERHDAVIDAFVRAGMVEGAVFDWQQVDAVGMREAVRSMAQEGIQVSYVAYLGGRTVTVRLSDRDGSDVHHCVTAAELDVLHGALQLDGAAAWARTRFVPHPRGSRRR